MNPLPNRIAVYLAAASALVLGLLPLVGNLDWTSTAGVVAALIAILGVVVKWLDGWSKYERGEGVGLLPGDELDDEGDEYLDLLEPPPDGFDEATAEPIPPAAAEAAHTPEPGTTYTPGPDDPPPGPRPDRLR